MEKNDRVRLSVCPFYLEAYRHQVGVVEEIVGDLVLARFGDLEVQVLAGMLVPVD